MPDKPLKPCQHPGCGVLGKGTYCEVHQRQRSRERDTNRPRRGGRRWRKLRDLKLRTNPICEICNTALSMEVDHIEPLAKAPEREFEWENLQSVCHDCHVAKTAADQGRAQGGGEFPVNWQSGHPCPTFFLFPRIKIPELKFFFLFPPRG